MIPFNGTDNKIFSESLSDKHWTEGGTAITNFPEEDFPIYIEAIQRFGDNDLIVSDQPFGPMRGMPGGSLHDLSRLCSLSPFWKVFEQVHREMRPYGYYALHS